MDKLTAAKYFLKVADTGSFSKTAKSLNLPVSTVSRRIKDLEQNLGVELFRRSTRFLALTDLGKVYYERIEGAVNDFNTVEELFQEATSEPSGLVKISALPSYVDIHLYPMLDLFRTQYPRITVDLHTTDNVEHLLRDKFDFIIRPTSRPPENLVCRAIDQHKMMLVASPSYVKEFGQISNPDDVSSHPALCYRNASGPMPWQSYKDGIWQIIEKTPHFVCNDTTELLRIATLGEGVALLPEWTAKSHLEEGLVEQINTGWQASFVDDWDHRLYLIYDKKVLDLKRNKMFLKFFLDHVA